MGRDIHMTVEFQDDKKVWHGLHAFPSYRHWNSEAKEISSWIHPSVCSRDYARFERILNAKDPGLPEDLSPMSAHILKHWRYDGHSQTWLTLREAMPFFSNVYDTAAILKDELELSVVAEELFGLEGFNDTEEPDWDRYRIIIWFDN